MAILFDDASNEVLRVDSAVVAAPPFTMSCWANSNDATVRQIAMYIGDKDVSNNDHWVLELGGSVAGDPARFIARDTGVNGIATTSTGYSTGTWHHICGVETSAASRAAFIDGGSKGTNTDSISPDAADRTSIANLDDGSTTVDFSGSIAEAAIWNIALSDAEVAILALGFSPLFIHPEALVFYLPMLALGGGGTQQDWIGGLTLTETNTPATAAHPPNIIYPSLFTTGFGFAAISSALSGTLNFRGNMVAIPLSAEYQVFGTSVPQSAFITRD